MRYVLVLFLLESSAAEITGVSLNVFIWQKKVYFYFLSSLINVAIASLSSKDWIIILVDKVIKYTLVHFLQSLDVSQSHRAGHNHTE